MRQRKGRQLLQAIKTLLSVFINDCARVIPQRWRKQLRFLTKSSAIRIAIAWGESVDFELTENLAFLFPKLR